MGNSEHLYRLAKILRGFGWQVNLYADLKFKDGKRYSGRCRHAHRQVDVGCSSARETLLVLAHEAGHVCVAARGGHLYHRLSETRREQLAYLYGWAILQTLRCGVGKVEWREHHEDLLAGNKR